MLLMLQLSTNFEVNATPKCEENVRPIDNTENKPQEKWTTVIEWTDHDYKLNEEAEVAKQIISTSPGKY